MDQDLEEAFYCCFLRTSGLALLVKTMPGPSNLKSNTTFGTQQHLGDSMAENTPVLGRINLGAFLTSLPYLHPAFIAPIHGCTCMYKLASLPCLPGFLASSLPSFSASAKQTCRHVAMQTCRHAAMQTCTHAHMHTCSHADGCRPPACIAACIAGRNHGRKQITPYYNCLLYTSPSPRDRTRSRMPSSA